MKVSNAMDMEVKSIRHLFGAKSLEEVRRVMQVTQIPSIGQSGHAPVVHATCGWQRSLHDDPAVSPVFALWVDDGKCGIQYLAFPEYRIAVELIHGLRLIWNPSFLHSTTSPGVGTVQGRYSFAFMYTLKTAYMACRAKLELHTGESLPKMRDWRFMLVPNTASEL